uniref:Alternative protein n=1 Tax=Macrostomum lignano TaxID=282301 RepID=A0A1I8IDY5_9PLAT
MPSCSRQLLHLGCRVPLRPSDRLCRPATRRRLRGWRGRSQTGWC